MLDGELLDLCQQELRVGIHGVRTLGFVDVVVCDRRLGWERWGVEEVVKDDPDRESFPNRLRDQGIMGAQAIHSSHCDLPSATNLGHLQSRSGKAGKRAEDR